MNMGSSKKGGAGKFIIIGAIVALAALAVLSMYKKPQKGKMTAAGKDVPGIMLLYNTQESHKAIAEAIQQQWKQELGIKVDLVNKEWKVYQNDTRELNFNIGRAGWIGDYNDPNTFLDMWLTDGGNNQTGWSNKEYDRLIAAAASESDPKKRMDIFKQAEDILINDEMPIMPIYFYVNTNVIKPWIKGLSLNLRDIHPLKYVWIEKNGRTAPPDRQVFTFNNGTEPKTLDTGLMTGNTEFNIASQLFEGLVQYDPKTLKPIPGMATHWEISDDQLTYTFHLRQGAKWTNGDPVTARDFVYSWERVLNPKLASEYAYQLFYIKNGKKYYEKKITDFKQVGVEAVDDATLVITLENPTAFWLDLLAFHTLLPVNRKCVDKHGEKWTRPENIVTNGPFKMTEWKPKDRIIMVKNEDYYDAGKVKLTKIIAISIESDMTSIRMFETGETEWVRTIPVQVIDKWLGKPVVHITPFLATYYYRFNVTKPPFNDKRVRMAFNLAVDKKAICDKILKQGQIPATTFVPPGTSGYTPPPGPGYDPGKARKLLQEAGYKVKK